MSTAHSEAIEQCPWLCTAPTGPSTPFAWPVFFVIDSVRILICVGALALILISVWSITRSTVHGQKTRFAGAVGLYLIVIGTELDRLGDTPHWRFLVAAASIPLLLWGYYQHLRHELPARNKPEPGDFS
jgi:hypothetical protein